MSIPNKRNAVISNVLFESVQSLVVSSPIDRDLIGRRVEEQLHHRRPDLPYGRGVPRQSAAESQPRPHGEDRGRPPHHPRHWGRSQRRRHDSRGQSRCRDQRQRGTACGQQRRLRHRPVQIHRTVASGTWTIQLHPMLQTSFVLILQEFGPSEHTLLLLLLQWIFGNADSGFFGAIRFYFLSRVTHHIPGGAGFRHPQAVHQGVPQIGV